MERLVYLILVFFSCKLSAQTFPVKNVNDEYVLTHLKGSEKYKSIKEVIRDKNGLCWFQNLTNVSSFDGVNWKDYSFTDAGGRSVPVRINEIEVTDDSTIWLATSEGMFGFNPRSETFVPVQKIFPNSTGIPSVTNCIYKGAGNFLVVSIINPGFYIFNWNNGAVKYVSIDSVDKINLDIDGVELFVTTDNSGNYWGVTKELKGIWCYNVSTGEMKRSWKGELFPTAARRWAGRRMSSLAYSRKDNALLIAFGSAGVLEKLYLSTGKSVLYSFSGDLNISADTTIKDRHSVLRVKIDPAGNEWILVGSPAKPGNNSNFQIRKYLVKLGANLSNCEYLEHDPDLLPLGKINWLLPEANMKIKDIDENRLWLLTDRGVVLLNKRNQLVRQISFEKNSVGGITPEDYIAEVSDGAKLNNIVLIKDNKDGYLLLQKNEGRPKIIRLDKNLFITHTLFNDKWKHYPAYFDPYVNSQNFYIAMLRPGDEPLDFRKVVVQDFRVDLQSMITEPVTLDFAERVRYYGVADNNNVYWLFSSGFIYSYDPLTNYLDSIFICSPLSKKGFTKSRIKGFDFPTVLHKNSSTFWISFIANKELYKIDLRKRKVDKIIKTCLNQKGCLQSAAYMLYEFDSSRIYLKFNMSAALLNPRNDSVMIYSDLFKSRLPYEEHVGSLHYGDWLCSITESEVNLQNTVTGKQKKLSLDQDFKWPLSPLFFYPVINDRREMILMSASQRGFVVFNVDSVLSPAIPGAVHFSSVKVNENELLLDSLEKAQSLQLKFNGYSSIHFRFSDYSFFNQDKISYEYTLYNGGDTVWNKIEGGPELTLTRITPGKYRLMIRAGNGFGDYSPQINGINISIIPLFTQTPWFIALIVLAVSAILYWIYRYRLQQVNRLQTIRNNIASDLHDDIGSTLNSISIYSEVAKQQAGKDIPALELIGSNSRKIIESMSDIVWTINPNNDSFEKIIVRMRSFAHQLLKAKKIDYTFDVDEVLNSVTLPMQVRKNFYLVFKEAMTNLVKYSHASRVAISLKSENKTVFLKILDNGMGIPANPESQGNGLINMKRRAEEIHASLNISSGNGEGTGVELILKA